MITLANSFYLYSDNFEEGDNFSSLIPKYEIKRKRKKQNIRREWKERIIKITRKIQPIQPEALLTN